MAEYFMKEVRHPYIENSDIRLREICNNRAKELYGENIPKEIAERIEWEISAIYRTGMTFAFVLLKELMDKNNLSGEDITLRGLSGGSLVLYLCGISNYNPMDFELTPYFTFGLEKDKWVDIDLNVPSSLQEKVVNSCKTLEGLVDAYRIENHIGGVVYIPYGSNIEEVKPSDSENGGIRIECNDYHTSNKIFYKQDILPQDDVELAYNLSRRLNIDSSQIKLDDTDILSLFSSTTALGITSDDIEGIKYGVIGLPEFKYSISMDMLDYIKINSFDDLVKMQGILHGTDTWFGNAEILLKEGGALSDAIATREDIFDYLVMKGLSKKDAYCITEQVRKGKGVREKDEELMKANEVPEWYINSCKKIQYLFPRTHCISYALNLWKLAYIKIHYPKEFYEEYFKVYKFDGLNEAISKGYEAFVEYAGKRKQAYDPMEGDEEYHDNYLKEEYCILVAREMFARKIDG